jgi:hypothetical protein
MSAQLDLFDWAPPRRLAVIATSIVKMWTAMKDGVPYWVVRKWDYATDGRFLESVNVQEAGPFANPEDAKKPFGRETPWPSEKVLWSKVREIGVGQ